MSFDLCRNKFFLIYLGIAEINDKKFKEIWAELTCITLLMLVHIILFRFLLENGTKNYIYIFKIGAIFFLLSYSRGALLTLPNVHKHCCIDSPISCSLIYALRLLSLKHLLCFLLFLFLSFGFSAHKGLQLLELFIFVFVVPLSCYLLFLH